MGERIDLLDSPGILPNRLTDQVAARRLAICDAIGEAAYSDAAMAAELVDVICAVSKTGLEVDATSKGGGRVALGTPLEALVGRFGAAAEDAAIAAGVADGLGGDETTIKCVRTRVRARRRVGALASEPVSDRASACLCARALAWRPALTHSHARTQRGAVCAGACRARLRWKPRASRNAAAQGLPAGQAGELGARGAGLVGSAVVPISGADRNEGTGAAARGGMPPSLHKNRTICARTPAGGRA